MIAKDFDFFFNIGIFSSTVENPDIYKSDVNVGMNEVRNKLSVVHNHDGLTFSRRKTHGRSYHIVEGYSAPGMR